MAPISGLLSVLLTCFLFAVDGHLIPERVISRRLGVGIRGFPIRIVELLFIHH